MDEMAYSINGENAHYGTTANPCAPGHVPGGSSSGSVVAVAASLADFALGTNTGGSVRVPAAYCGIFGLRPSHRVVSAENVVPMAQMFDTVGWFARDVATLYRVSDVLLPPVSTNTADAELRQPSRVMIQRTTTRCLATDTGSCKACRASSLLRWKGLRFINCQVI
ncbi:hypothetical protein ZWY2020_038043 [Hordeum vulgare]|nr:hypothetical protein ZWY2020_038043 [Hordeum vulgare]